MSVPSQWNDSNIRCNNWILQQIANRHELVFITIKFLEGNEHIEVRCRPCICCNFPSIMLLVSFMFCSFFLTACVNQWRKKKKQKQNKSACFNNLGATAIARWANLESSFYGEASPSFNYLPFCKPFWQL